MRRLGILLAATALGLGACKGDEGPPRPAPAPAPPTLQQQVVADANAAAQSLDRRGYEADFSPAGLRAVDRFLARESDGRGRPRPGSVLATRTDLVLRTLGAYVGETLRRSARDGRYARRGGELELAFGNGTLARPEQAVRRRLSAGGRASLAAYGRALLARARG